MQKLESIYTIWSHFIKGIPDTTLENKEELKKSQQSKIT